MSRSPHPDHRPVVLLVFANDRRTADGAWLRQLPTERRAIASALFEAEQEQHCHVVDDANVTHRTFFDMVVRHRKDIVGVHFGGHADPGGLHFEDEHGNPVAARMDAIAKTLGALPALRWVFLNGCGTAEHVAVLHGRVNVPVVATERAIRDDIACSFAERFYMSLANGHTLGLAFGFAEAEVRSLHPDPTGIVRGALEAPEYFQDRLLRPASGSGATRWPWVLRYPPGDEACLEWQLVPGDTVPEIGVAGGSHETAAPDERSGRPWFRAWIAALAALAAAALVVYLLIPDGRPEPPDFTPGPSVLDVGPESGPRDPPDMASAMPPDMAPAMTPDGAPDMQPDKGQATVAPVPSPHPPPRPRCLEAPIAEVVGLFAAGRCQAGATRRRSLSLPRHCVGRARAVDRMETAASTCARRCGPDAAQAARAAAEGAYDQACHRAMADFVARCPETEAGARAVTCPSCGDGRTTHQEKCDPKEKGTGPPCLANCKGIQL